MRVLVSILILSNLLIGSDAGNCQHLELKGFDRRHSLDGPWSVYKKEGDDATNVHKGGFPVYKQKVMGRPERFMYRSKKKWVIGNDLSGGDIVTRRKGKKQKKVSCKKGRCKFEPGTGEEEVICVGDNKPKPKPGRERTDASAMMQGDAVTEQSASGLSSADFMLMAAGAAVGALLVAVAVAVVVAMRKRKSAKRTEMEMTEAVHVPDSSVMTPDATEKKAEGDEDAVTVHSHHAAEVTVSVSMDDEAVQVEA